MTNEEKFKEIFGITTGRLYNMPSSCFHKWESEKCAEQRTGRWISCKERLPEVGSIVLCSCKHREFLVGKINVCKYCAPDKYSDKPYFDFNMDGFPTVEAWMPLPEPYKESENEQTEV